MQNYELLCWLAGWLVGWLVHWYVVLGAHEPKLSAITIDHPKKGLQRNGGRRIVESHARWRRHVLRFMQCSTVRLGHSQLVY